MTTECEPSTSAVPLTTALSDAPPLAEHAPTPAELPAHPLAGTQRVQLVLAGTVWLIAACILSLRGARWLAGSRWMWPLVLGAVALGVLKARILLDRVVRSAAKRIRDRGPDVSPTGFLSLRSWAVTGAMMALGYLLRLTPLPHVVLGVLYIAIATALIVASRVYWRAVGKGWDALA